jgi:hypothetical protein
MINIYTLFEQLKNDKEYAGLQLVLAGLKPACTFELYDIVYEYLDFSVYSEKKGQDLSINNLYWYVFKDENCLHLFTVNRAESKKFNEKINIKNESELSSFETIIVNGLWKENQGIFGKLMGYPEIASNEFEKEMKNGKQRKDRIKEMFFYTKKDQVGFISYPECANESVDVLMNWANYIKELGVDLYNDHNRNYIFKGRQKGQYE